MKISKKQFKKSIEHQDPLEGDLSDLLESGNWQRVRFELKPKNKTITIRLSKDLLDAVKRHAERVGLDYQKFIRIMLERLLLKV